MKFKGMKKRQNLLPRVLVYSIPLMAVLVMILMVSIDYYHRIHRNLKDDVFMFYRENAENIASEYRNLAENVMLFSRILSHSSYLRETLLESSREIDSPPSSITRSRLEMLQKEFEGIILSYQLYNKEKKLVFSFPRSTRVAEIQGDRLGRIIAGTMDKKEAVIQSFEIPEGDGTFSSHVLFATPVFSSENDRHVSGVICCWIDLDYAHREFFSEKGLNKMKLVEIPEIFFLSREGGVLYHTGRKSPADSFSSLAAFRELYRQNLVKPRDPGQGKTFIIEGKECYYIYTPLSLSLKSKKGKIRGPDYTILYILPHSIFQKRLTSSIWYIAVASSLFFILLAIPWLVMYKALYREEKERNASIEKELRVAYEIQVTMLPEETVRMKGFDIHCKSIPARQVGGDFYDHISIGEKGLFLVIGDASGKGVPGALMMTVAKSLIGFVSEQEKDPAEILCKVNHFMEKNTESGRFVTVLLGHLDSTSRLFRYVLAGHEPPLLCRDGCLQELEGGGGSIIGCFPEIVLKSQELKLEQGDILILYTDGCTDVWNEERKKIPEADLWKSALQNRHLPAKAISSGIFQTIQDFQGSRDQHDDRTLIIVKVE